MKDRFASYHPLVNFLYFALVIGFSMSIAHPLAQVLSFICAFLYGVQTQGRQGVMFCLKWCLPMFLLTAFINPAFSHEGMTILTYLPTGNPLTLESILYGLSAGLTLVTVLLWFMNFNRVITSDKFIYLFGRIIPALSLVLSMTLRFIPKFKGQLAQVKDAQKSMGRDPSNGNIIQRTKTAVTILSIMVTWALENAIETADSMKSRGYGLKGRSAYSIYRFDHRDRTAMNFLCFCGMYILTGAMTNGFGFRYYPRLRYISLNAVTLSFQLVYFMLCIMPVVLNCMEEKQWKAIHSNM
ncbi:MAG: energy-coupling factor transporter transmembrane protein EcfT [Oscillospiraceae bacterium]|nr:energy-coupling factor transporter transmembrane protein EcfT [Oscillospiraceae bacterium]